MAFVNPWIPAGDPYQPTESYISISEYLNAAADVDTDNLVPGGTQAEQNFVLLNKIAAASGYADTLCHQTLAATVDNETASDLYVQRGGWTDINYKYWPLQQVNSISVGSSPASLTPLADITNLWLVGRTTMRVPVGLLSYATLNPGGPIGGYSSGGRLVAEWQYVNGWPLAQITTDAMAGDTELHLSNTLAFYTVTQRPTAMYKIFDMTSADESTGTTPGMTENVMVESITGTTLTLTAPLLYDHVLPDSPDSINISGMPDKIKQAVVFLTSFLIKARGYEAVVLPSSNGNTGDHEAAGLDTSDLDSAMDLLAYYDRSSL